MAVRVTRVDGVHRLVGDVPLVEVGNRWLAHLEARNFSAATVRGYAFDLLCLARVLDEAGIGWTEIVPSDVFDWLEWQARPALRAGERVVGLGAGRGAAPATMNRRVAAARSLFEYAVMCGLADQNPVPAPRRSSGLRARRGGLLGHVAVRRTGAPARLVRQDRPLPETVETADIEAFLADLNTHRDRAMTLAMLLGGLRAGEVPPVAARRCGHGDAPGHGSRQGKQAAGRADRPPVLRGGSCLSRPGTPQGPDDRGVLRGPTSGQAMTAAGLRKIFRVLDFGLFREGGEASGGGVEFEVAQVGLDLFVESAHCWASQSCRVSG